jgi:regulator of sigma E protease
MAAMSDILLYFLVFIVLIGPLMIIHELGHYLGAKAAGVRVEEFGLGFPPRMVKLFQHGETQFTLNWLPLGAFVKMTGEDDPNDPRSLAAAPKRWRLITLAAGPFMNFIGAFVIFALAYLLFFVRPVKYQYRIMEVNPGSAAEVIGLRAGDAVQSVNGAPMVQRITYENAEQPPTPSHTVLRDAVLAAEGRAIEVVVLRPQNAETFDDAQSVTLRATVPQGLDRKAPLGIRLAYEMLESQRVPYTFGEAVSRAAADFSRIVQTIVNLPTEIAQRGMTLEQARPVSVIGMTQMGVSLIQNRDVEGYFQFVWFAGFISFALGLTNLLPLPALDGGRIVFVLIEWVRGKPVDPQRQQWVHGIGFALLLGLSLLIMVLDVVRPIVPMR